MTAAGKACRRKAPHERRGTHAITNSLAAYLAGFTTTADPGDYSLKAVSILCDKGNPANYPTQDRTGSNRYTGNAPDLGAYEGP